MSPALRDAMLFAKPRQTPTYVFMALEASGFDGIPSRSCIKEYLRKRATPGVYGFGAILVFKNDFRFMWDDDCYSIGDGATYDFDFSMPHEVFMPRYPAY